MQTRNFALNIGLLFFAQLMALQSRFGTDERFRMDSRFLEEEEEVKEEDSGETVDAGTVAGKCRKVDQDGETPCFLFFVFFMCSGPGYLQHNTTTINFFL